MSGAKRDPQKEAAVSVGPGWRPQVLEPSPPADLSEPYLADDPLVEPPGDGTIVSPLGVLPSSLSSLNTETGNGETAIMTWSQLVKRQPDLGLFASERWLAEWRNLEPLPDTFAASRLGLHRVAAYVVSAARRQANGKIGLRHSRNGFGTPFYVELGDDAMVATQVRVEGTQLVYQHGDEVRAGELTTLNAAAGLLGLTLDIEWAADYDVPEPGDLDAELGIDKGAAASLADWFGFAFSVLEELRADEASVDASRPQLWPEHFDAAVEIGADDARQRASFGLSPGGVSEEESEPYLYISAWYPDDLPSNPFWNSELFPGAVLPYSELIEAGDQRQVALEFFRTGRYFLIGNEA
jgi:hypothetical protein